MTHNDFSPAFERIQRDTSAYYVLGFRSTDTRRDGRYRKLTVKINRPDVKLEYRPGYYAPADFQHSKPRGPRTRARGATCQRPARDRCRRLSAGALLPHRRHATSSFPSRIVVPGSQIPFTKGGDRDKATLDIIGDVNDPAGHVIGNARQTVKLAIDQSQQVRRKNIQYSTGFTLPIGKFHLKFVVRENETGRMGSFETDINIPDLRKTPLKLSSVVLASQTVPNANKRAVNPLVRDGVELVPNLPHVFRRTSISTCSTRSTSRSATGLKAAAADKGPSTEPKPAKDATTPVRVLTSIEFLNGATKVYETPLVKATELNVPARQAVAFQFDVPLAQLKAGLYICQINVIDDAGGSFSFPRTALLVREPAQATAPPSPTMPATPAPAPGSPSAPGR